MSTSRGSSNRTRPQKHQNRTAFKNDLHDTSKKTKIINSLEISGVCKRCKEIIDWKIKYKKYKPLTAPRKCVTCSQKTVKHAYHVLCKACADEKKVCAKCYTALEFDKQLGAEVQSASIDLTEKFKTLPERKRRTMLRYLKKYGESVEGLSPEVMSDLEKMLLKINLSMNDGSDDDYNEDDDDDYLTAFLAGDCNELKSGEDK